jgi:hypothetical protein
MRSHLLQAACQHKIDSRADLDGSAATFLESGRAFCA